MASKKSTHGSNGSMDSTIHTGADAMKDGFEKAVKTYDQLMAFGKDNAEAVLRSANAAGKGLENINSEVFAFGRKFFEGGLTAAKAVLSAKTFEEAIHLQGEYGKALFQTQVNEAARISELALTAARQTAEPFQARAAAVAEFVRVG